MRSRSSDPTNGELIVLSSRISVISVLLYWLSVPSLLSFFFFRFILPKIRHARQAAETLVGENSFISQIGGLVNILLTFVFLFLLIIWIVFCLIMTRRMLDNRLVFTEARVIGHSQDQALDAPLSEVKDVFVEQNLLGRLFRYGCVTVTTKRGSLSVKNLDRPQKFRDFFLKNPEIFTGGGMF